MKRPLSDTERLDWLQLIRTAGIGPITFYRLITKFGSAGRALEALPEFSRKSGRSKPLVPANRSDAERELAKAWQAGAQVLAACEPEYPALLVKIADPPPLIYLQGHITLFEKPSVAIIGARNASGLGRKMARQLAQDLGAEGIVVTSGLARGIDGAAHAAALATGTIAVVAGGIDYNYPPEHEGLTREIANQGVLMSERPLGIEPTARDFPRRNRLISGISRGVVIVEAAARSGTLITARYALEQGREVFAIPGSPLDPRSQGANGLLRDGATLVENANDILDALSRQLTGMKEPSNENEMTADLFDALNASTIGADSDRAGVSSYDDPEWQQAVREQIFSLIGYSPIHCDEIVRESNVSASVVASTLLELVLSGEITEASGGMFVRSETEAS